MLREVLNHVIIEEQTKNVYDQTSLSMGTWTVVDTDVSDMEENDDTLGNAYLDVWVYCSSSTYYPTTFEYCQENNTKGFMSSNVFDASNLTNRDSWGVGWHHIVGSVDNYKDASNTDWSNMDRLEIYRSGPSSGTDTSQYITFKNCRLIKYASNDTFDSTAASLITAKGNFQPGGLTEVGPITNISAYYPMDGNAEDYSGNGNDGAPSGATLAYGTHEKQCYDFTNSVADKIDLNSEISCDDSAEWSISFWGYKDSYGTDGICGHDSQVTSGGRISFENSSSMLFSFTPSGSTYFTPSSSFLTSQWFHFCITHNSSNSFTVYVNGSSMGAFTYSGGLNIKRIGDNPDDSSWTSFNGKMMDFRVYDKVLTTQEIYTLAKMYNNEGNSMQINNDNSVNIFGQILEK